MRQALLRLSRALLYLCADDPFLLQVQPVADDDALIAGHGNDSSSRRVGKMIRLAHMHSELQRFVQDGFCYWMFGLRFRDRRRFEQGCAADLARGTISVTAGMPNVRVPVLSSRMVSTSASFSRYNPPLTIAPSCAARPMEPRMARGEYQPVSFLLGP